MPLSSTEIEASPRCPAVPRPGPSILKTVETVEWLCQRASLVTSRVAPVAENAVTVNVAV